MSLVARSYLWGRSLHIRNKRRRRGDSEYELLPMLVKSDKSAVDVGANRGVYTFPMAERAKHVFAYEPSPWVAGLLKRGAPKNVTVRNFAVSDERKTVTLRVPIRGDGTLAHNQGSIERYGDEGTASAEVQAVRLDDEGLEDVGFIKIDAEDHELMSGERDDRRRACKGESLRCEQVDQRQHAALREHRERQQQQHRGE